MCHLLETLQLSDGELQNLAWHNRRYNASRRELFGILTQENIANLIEIPAGCREGLFRCRLTYGHNETRVEFMKYEPRKITSLKLVYDDEIDYHLKYADRSRLERLFLTKGACDDIIIVKNNCITDSYAANLVFSDGYAWYTPDTPLLRGTCRARLLECGTITEARITTVTMRQFRTVGLINAFLEPGNMPVITVDSVEGWG